MSSSISNSKFKHRLLILLWLLISIFLLDKAFYLLFIRMEKAFSNQSGFAPIFQKFVANKHYSTLIMGTSRTYEGIHPILIKKYLNQNAYKEGYIGKGPKYYYYFYQLYKKYAGIPKVVIYGVDYFIFDITSDPKLMSRFDLKEDKDQKHVFSAPLLLVKYKQNIDNFFNNILISVHDKALKQESDTFKELSNLQQYLGIKYISPDFIIERPETYHRQLYPHFPGKEGDYFQALMNDLAMDGVKVILLAIPDHVGSGATNYQYKIFHQDLRTFTQTYPKHVFFINYDRKKKFPIDDPSCFINGGWGKTNCHLSQKGAKILNERLCEELKPFYNE